MARDGIADVTYVNPGYQPGRFPIIAAGQLAVHVRRRQEGHAGARRVVSQICADRDEGHQVSASRSFMIPARCTARRRSWCPDDLKGIKVRPAQSTIGEDGQAARRHQRAGLGAGSARRDRARRGRRDHLPLGFDVPVRHRQGRRNITWTCRSITTLFTYNINLDKYNSMSPAQKKVDRRPLHAGMGGEGHRSLGRFRGRGRVKMKAVPGHEVYPLTAEQLARMEEGGASRCTTAGPTAVKKTGGDPGRSTPICRRR